MTNWLVDLMTCWLIDLMAGLSIIHEAKSIDFCLYYFKIIETTRNATYFIESYLYYTMHKQIYNEMYCGLQAFLFL